jgi:hypothetical protein
MAEILLIKSGTEELNMQLLATRRLQSTKKIFS